MVSRCGWRWDKRAMNREDRGFLARMGARGKPDRSSREEARQMRDHTRIGGRRR